MSEVITIIEGPITQDHLDTGCRNFRVLSCIDPCRKDHGFCECALVLEGDGFEDFVCSILFENCADVSFDEFLRDEKKFGG